MRVFNYQKICQELLKDLPERQKEVISRRFGLSAGTFGEGQAKRETLESIGKSFNLTRERIRQIEEKGLSRLKPKIKKYQEVFQYFRKLLKKNGGLKKEDILLSQLGGENYQNHIFFLLTLSRDFQRFAGKKDIYSFWTINPDFLNLAQKVIALLVKKLEEINRPLTFPEFKSLVNFPFSKSTFQSFLEISRQIQKNEEGLFGLRDWPEINPKRVKDKAYLVFKKAKTPLHFSKVAELIGNSCLVRTVHNELIKDPRFVLIGRGIYALQEWGYEPGQVKDVIFKILKENGPLTKSEILEKVLKQRLVKETTILLNLANKKYFLKDPQDRYWIKEA